MNERLDRHAFEWLAATVAATLAVHLGHLPLWLSLPLACVLGLRVWSRRRGAAKVSAWVRLPLTALLVILVVANFGNLFGREPGSVLACGLLALKLLETERVRDARVALGFAAFVLMSALLFTQTLPFTLLICAVLLMLLAALVSLQPAPPGTHRSPRQELRVSAWLLGASLPLAALAFLLVPRLGSPLWGTPGQDMTPRTGLGERMAPGSMTDLLIDDAPAFRVDFDQGSPPPPAQRYFRTIVFWDFDGSAWTRERRVGAGRVEALGGNGARLHYSITLEPTDRRWLPTLDVPMDAPAQARLGSDRVLVANVPVAQPRQYRVVSTTGYVLAPTLHAIERQQALALPDGFDPRTRALGAQWRAQGLSDDAIVTAALDRFRASFTYTLTPPLLGRHSVDDFLFDTQRGFCEHFAGSFVFLMRAAGIPARVVTGYQGGWWSKNNSYLLLRQSDAHAWAEVWIDGSGWRRVDPTAAVSPQRIELGAAAANGAADWSQSIWLRDLRNRFDMVNRVWTQSIIRFDSLRQKSLLTPFGVADANPGDLLLTLSALLGLMLVIATVWAMHLGKLNRGDVLDQAWNRLLGRLVKIGIERRGNEGPLDLLQRVREKSPAIGGELEPLIHEYARLRYGVAVAPTGDIARFAQVARKFRLNPRQDSGPTATIGGSGASK